MQLLRRFSRSTDANFGVIAGLAALPLIVALGGAVDMARLHRVSEVAQQAADAAALAAAKRLETGTESEAKTEGQTFGQAQLSSMIETITMTQVIDKAAGTVQVSAKGEVKTAFLPLINISTLPFERVSKAAMKQKAYLNFQFLLDVSESMNIAASDADRIKLQAITMANNNRPCAFACHTHEKMGKPYTTPYSVWQMNENAGSNKARLRIDVLREAADAMINKLLEKNNELNSFMDVKIQTNGFGPTFEKGEGPSTDALKLKNSIRTFKVANDHTNFTNALSGLTGQLGTQGSGKLATEPMKVALLITDGVKDEGFGSSSLGPITPALCENIKSKGFSLAVLEIKYVEDYDFQGYYKARVAPFYKSISPNLEACASKGMYNLASDANDAQEKLLSLAERLVTNSLRVAK